MTKPVTSDDVIEQPRRPIGAQLAVLGDRAVRAPGDAAERVLFEEVPATWHGARQLVLDIRHWRRNEARLAEIAADKAFAARQNMIPAKYETSRREAEQEAQRRWAVLVGYVASAFLLVTVASVIGFWAWHQWRLFGLALMLLQLGVGRYYRQAKRLSAVLMGTSWVWVPVFLALDITDWRWWPWWVAGGLLLLACEQRGMRMAREMPGSGGPGDDAHEGVSLPKLWERIETRLAPIAPQHQHTRLLVVNGQEVGAAIGLTSHDEVKDQHVKAVARAVHLGQRWVRWVFPPDEAVGELVMFWRNPLEQVPPPPRYRFGDLSYGSWFSIGMTDSGAPELVCIAYTSVLVFGVIGSGKSSVVRLIIVAVEVMPDADLYGIDTAGNSTLGAQRKRLGPTRVACGAQEVEAGVRILDELIVEAGRRSSCVDAGEDYDEDGVVDDRFLVADKPGRRGIVLVIGEYHHFCASADLVTRLLTLLSVARKAAVSIVVETPTLGKEELGEGRHLIRHMMLRIAMSCTVSDVVLGLGAGELERGWRADQLQPQSEGKRNDAGVGYVWGGGRNRSRLTGFHPMEPADAALMREAIRPQRNHWYGLPADAPGDPRCASAGVSYSGPGDDPDVVDAEIVSEEDVAREAAIRKAIGLCGDRPGLTPSEASDGLTADERGHVRRAAPSRSTYFPDSGASDRAHRVSDLVSALSDSTGRSTA